MNHSNFDNLQDYKYKTAVMRRRRRRVQVRQQKLIMSALLITAILFFSISIGARLTFAKAGGNGIKRVKYYRSVMITRGDSLEHIAQDKYTDDWKDMNSLIHEIERINHLNEDEELIAGNWLIIPYYVDRVSE